MFGLPVQPKQNGGLLFSLALSAVLATAGAFRIASTYSVFSQTWDEPSSVASGMQWLDEGVYRYDPKHPPLGRVAAALGLYLSGARSTGNADPYAEGNALLGYRGEYRRNLALARAGLLPFFLAACFAVWLWAWWAFGPRAAALAVMLFSSLPAVLGHAGVAMTDIALTATLPAALFAFCLWLGRPNPGNCLLLGATAGLTILSKFTSLVFLPFCGAPVALLYAFRWRRSAGRLRQPMPALALALPAAVACAVIWAGYRFSLFPFPAHDFFAGVRQLWTHNDEGHPNYVLGEIRTNGWWWFYPVILAAKTPAGFLILLAAGVWFLARDPIVRRRWRCWTPALAAAGMLAAGLLSHINTGVRHILPIYAMLAGLAGFGALRLLRAGLAARVACVALLAWHTWSAAAAHPDYLAYFNELLPGENGRFGVDSDLDWGQDLWRLRDACARHGVPSLWLAYYGSADPGRFDLPPRRDLPPDSPQSGWVAISLFKLKLGASMDGNIRAVHGYSWLEKFQPVERAGRSIRLYFIPPDSPAVRP